MINNIIGKLLIEDISLSAKENKKGTCERLHLLRWLNICSTMRSDDHDDDYNDLELVNDNKKRKTALHTIL